MGPRLRAVMPLALLLLCLSYGGPGSSTQGQGMRGGGSSRGPVGGSGGPGASALWPRGLQVSRLGPAQDLLAWAWAGAGDNATLQEAALRDVAQALGCSLQGQLCRGHSVTCLAPGGSLSVECDSAGLPAALQLRGLRGRVPVSLAALGALTSFEAEQCEFATSPLELLPRLPRLRSAVLDACLLPGSLPARLGVLSALTALDVRSTPLEGSIPDQASRLTALRRLKLANCSLSGPMPGWLGAPGTPLSLRELDLSYNALQGSLPPGLGRLGQLQRLLLGANALQGSIPAALSALAQLRVLSLFSLPLQGPVPAWLGAGLPRLQCLRLANANLEGGVPASLGDLGDLTLLDLADNRLVGPMPASLAQLTRLRSLSLSNNFLSGVPLLLNSSVEVNLQGNFLYSDAGTDYSRPEWRDYSLAGNCLGLAYRIKGEGGLDRKPAECTAFCNTSTTSAPCGGLGTCTPVENGPGYECRDCQAGTVAVGSTCAMSVTEPPDSGTPGIRPGVVAGVVAAALLLGLLVLLALLFRRRILRLVGRPSRQGLDPGLSSAMRVQGVTEFPVETLTAATNNFSRENLLGKGGFGEVFFGVLPASDPSYPGQRVAVKRQRKPSSGSTRVAEDRAFLREVEILCQVRHRNVVELRGSYAGAHDRFLVYEFVERGSLEDILKLEAPAPRRDLLPEGPTGSAPPPSLAPGPVPDSCAGPELQGLGWETRLKLAVGAASGLNYLHYDLTNEILHLDVKSANILVDASFNAKVADFGISKVREASLVREAETLPWALQPLREQLPSFHMEAAHTTLQTKGCMGTPCYFDPYYFADQTLTKKSDVYSFGIVLLELATGWSPKTLLKGGSFTSFPRLVASLVQQFGFQSVAAPAVAAAFPPHTHSSMSVPAAFLEEPTDAPAVEQSAGFLLFRRFVCVALWCCIFAREQRPSMSQVLQALKDLQEGRWHLGGEACVLSARGDMEMKLWESSNPPSSGSLTASLGMISTQTMSALLPAALPAPTPVTNN